VDSDKARSDFRGAIPASPDPSGKLDEQERLCSTRLPVPEIAPQVAVLGGIIIIIINALAYCQRITSLVVR
jgi:hypothetical protein